MDHEVIPPAGPSTLEPKCPTVPDKTPVTWRIAIVAGILAVAAGAFAFQAIIGVRGQAVAGVIVFFGLVAGFSSNLRAVNWRTIGWGFGLQLILALLVLKGRMTAGGQTYSVKGLIQRLGEVFKVNAEPSLRLAVFTGGVSDGG